MNIFMDDGLAIPRMSKDSLSIQSVRSHLRHLGFSEREKLSKDNHRIFSHRACWHIAHTLKQKMGDISQMIIAGYWPIRSELDPNLFLEYVVSHGGRLALPAIIDDETMVFRAYSPHTPLESMRFHTMGPEASSAVVTPTFILVPLLAFDRQYNRLGYGKGYYDRAIAALKAEGHCIDLFGLGFSCQEVESIPNTKHDLVLQGIFTEKGFLER
ncbi:5-formyltetrahydrofolate cyclo-ligase [Bartonella bacilliformis]|nr:5-formyltetrahydrofolate cyclo-ligase [Bartonella bacilliformis]